MKQKLTAAALALCLVLGLLPMSALAARYKGSLNGQEITIDVNDETGAVTLPGDLLDHYSVAPETLTVGSFPKTQDFTLAFDHYGEAPGTITVTGTLVEETAGQTFTVSFAAGDHATGTKEAEALTVPEGETSVEYTLPDAEGFTPESGYVFSGWQVGDDASAVKQAGEKLTVSADVTLTAQWTAEGETVVTVTPTVDASGSATVKAEDVAVTEATETVVLDLSSRQSATVTVQSGLVESVKENSVETVQVKTALATADVPVEALPASGDATIAVTPAAITESALPEGTADAVKTAVTNGAKAVSVTVKDKDGNNLLPKKDSYPASAPTITITINGLVTGKTYVVLCLSVDGSANSLTSFGRFSNIAQSTLSFRSKHLSAYIAVEETAENAAALAAVTADPGSADAETPVVSSIKVTSVQTDIAPFTKVQVTGLKSDKVYLIRVGAGTGKAGQAVFYVDHATSYDFYCNADSATGSQTVMVWELNSKADIASGKMPAPAATETVTKVS